MPEGHLEACWTCNSNGLECGKVKDSGPGLKDVDFVLYVSAIATPQCGEFIGKSWSCSDLRGGCSTVVECMPRNRTVMGLIPARCWAFFSLYSQ